MPRRTLTIDDRKLFDKALRAIDGVDGSFVEIGINEKEGSERHPGNPSDGRQSRTSTATVAEVAFFNEYGTSKIPERSFIRSTVDEKRARFERIRDRQLNLLVQGKTSVQRGLDTLGFDIQQAIRNKIITLSSPPNAPSTQRIKGFNNPLIDSQRMLNSITFKTTVK
jgi:hypothetical protein